MTQQPRIPWTVKWVTGQKGRPPRWVLALDSHLAWGFGVPSFFGWVFKTYFGAAVGALVIFVIALLKEYFADPYYEGEPFFWDGVEDLLEYVAGIAFAFALYFFATVYL